METKQLKIEFGKDQEVGIDRLLEEMKSEGRVLQVEKTPLSGDEDQVGYVITFDGIYAVYVFGWKSAGLLAYLFQWHKNSLLKPKQP